VNLRKDSLEEAVREMNVKQTALRPLIAGANSAKH